MIEIYAAINKGEATQAQREVFQSWSDDHKKEIKKNKPSLLKRVGTALGFGKSQPDYIIDPNVRELGELTDRLVGGAKKQLSSIIPEKRKEQIEELKESEIVKRVSEDERVKKVVSKAKEKKSEIGEKLTSADAVERTSGIVSKALKPINAIGGFAGKVRGNFTSSETLKGELQDTLNDYAPGGDRFSASSSDTLLMQEISSEANIIMSNGTVDSSERQRLLSNIDALNDKRLARRLKQSLVPLMERNSSKDKSKGGNEGKTEPNTPLKKIGSMIWSSMRLPIFIIYHYIKKVITSVFSMVKTGLKTLFNLAKKGITTGFRQIKYGAKSFAEGVSGVMGKVFKGVGAYTDIVYKEFDKLKNGFTNTLGNIIDKFNKAKEKANEKKGNKEVSESEGTSEKKPSIFSRASSFIKDKIDNGDGFLNGLFSARRERKEAEERSKLDAEAKPIVKAMEQTGMTDIKTSTDEMADVLKDESESGKGFMKPILKILNKLIPKDEPQPTTETPETNPETDKDKTNKSTPMMDDLYADNPNAANANNTTPQMGDIGSVRSSDLGGNKPTTAETTITSGEKKPSKLSNSIGKIVGGIWSMMGGLLNVVLSMVLSMEGAKQILNLAVKLLTESLKPLNEAFQAILKVIKPLMKQISGIIKQLSEFIVQVVEVVCDIIKPIMEDVVKPILELLSPMLETIIGLIAPLLKLVGIILKSILAPLMGIFKYFIMPILQIISDAVQVIMGVVQFALGAISGILGGILTGVGWILAKLGAKDLGKQVQDSGSTMVKNAGDLIENGITNIGTGMVNFAADSLNMLTLGASDELLGRDQETEVKKTETKKIKATDDDTVEKTYANGDITNNYFNGSSDIYNTYAGEYQRSMGGYLNMDQRGCGPIALADMYNRNKAGRLSARTLAGSMYGSGAYDPRRGTSVGAYIDTARRMGINAHAGKVTQQSLKSASPSNPITVVGSGSDYGTRNGNNHFMNVIGTDSHGGAYISNPLTGRIDRKPTSTVAGSAIVGIYGSGDEADGGYTFPDAIKQGFKKLKEEAAKILGLFSMDTSDEEETEEIIDNERKRSAADQAKKALGEDYAEYEEKAKKLAFSDFLKRYPKKDSESDDEYESLFEKWWNGTADQAKYLGEAGVMDDMLDKSRNKTSEIWTNIANSTSDFITKTSETLSGVKDWKDTSSSSSYSGGGSGSFTSDSGVELWTPYSDNIEITDTDITKSDYNSPLFEFFAKTMGLNIGAVTGSGWFSHYDNPNREGVGSSGGSHGGVDFTGDIDGKPLYATTGGTVVANWSPEQSNGGGNAVVWRDSAGKLHWYMHMKQRSTLNVGDEIQGGDLIGYVGNTGTSTGTHLHYTINDSLAGSSSGAVNPLMYFNNYTPKSTTLVGGTNDEKIWAYLRNHGFEPHAAAGVMGSFQVESGNDPSALEGYYYFDTGTVQQAMQSYDSMDDYVVNKLFPRYKRDGLNINWDGYRGSDGHYYPGIGLAQWTGSRTRSLSDYTIGKGLPWSDLGGQLQYLSHELDTVSRYSSAVTSMNNSNDVNSSTDIWLSEFEGNPGAAVEERRAYAREFYNRFINWTPQTAQTFTPTGQGSSSTGYGMVNSAADARRVDNYRQIQTYDGKNTGTVYTESDDLNLRSSPSIDSPILITIPRGTHLNLEASGDPNWFKTTYAGKTGYVSSAYILLDNDAANDFDYSPTTDVYGTNDYSKQFYIDAYEKTARIGAPNVKTSDVIADFQNYLMDNGMSMDDIISVGDELYDGKWKSGDYLKLWQWARDQYNNNTSYTNSDRNALLQYAINQTNGYSGTSKSKSKSATTTPVTTNGGSGMYNTNNAVSRTTYTTVASGDMSDMDFWSKYMDWNNSYANSNITTPIGMDDIVDTSSETFYDDATGTTVVNTYNVTRGEDKATEARIKAILANTYNVRSDSMEALLEAILEELKRRKGDVNGKTKDTTGSTKLFDEGIPAQIAKLSLG